MRGAQQIYGKISGTLDIWWLVDDGGLPILLSYLIQIANPKTELRVMTIPANPAQSARHTILIAQMLKQV